MKRLLSVVAMLAVVVSLVPAKGQAGLRGAFGPITTADDNLIRGKFSPALRDLPKSGAGTAQSPFKERWLAFVTLSSVVGNESTGEIWLNRNLERAALVSGIFPVPLLRDPTAAVSYIDPAWSKDGKWLAYVKTNNNVTESSIYLQQFDTSTATDGNVALGTPILVADGTGGIHHRHPAFNQNGTQIAYDSDATGLSIDLYTVAVTLNATTHTGTVGTPVRHLLGLDGNLPVLNSKAEFKPAYSPDGTKIAYVTNRFGAFQIQIVTLTADGTGETDTASEVNPALITHDNPVWSPDGLKIYYDAPSGEDASNPQDIWRLELATGNKCAIGIDLTGDVDPDVSPYTNVDLGGNPFNYFVFISQAGGLGVQIWLGDDIYSCTPPLPMNVTLSPTNVSVDNNNSGNGAITGTLSFPASVRALGYVCRAANVGGEAVRMRVSILSSPTMAGLHLRATPGSGDCTNMDMLALVGGHESCFNVLNVDFGNIGNWDVVLDPNQAAASAGGNDDQINAYWDKRTMIARAVALGLLNRIVPLEVRCYSNRVGQQFQGIGYMRFNSSKSAGSIVLRQNYPNPFNPVTKINFAVDRPGNVDVRVFNTRGELVRTITNQWYPQGDHSVSWDGRTLGGGHAPSGIYYIRAKSGSSTDVIKAVLAK